MEYNTLDVDLNEISKIPPIIARIETSIPMFITYTERPIDKEAPVVIDEKSLEANYNIVTRLFEDSENLFHSSLKIFFHDPYSNWYFFYDWFRRLRQVCQHAYSTGQLDKVKNDSVDYGSDRLPARFQRLFLFCLTLE